MQIARRRSACCRRPRCRQAVPLRPVPRPRHSCPSPSPPLQAASLSTSLSTLNSATGGVTSAARRHVRSLGVPGLDIGFGCGVMLGYGWGAGLMLKPSALTSLTATLQSAGRAVVERLPQPMQAALAQRQAQQQAAGGWGPIATGAPAAGLGSTAASSTALGLQDLQQHQQGKLGLWSFAAAGTFCPGCFRNTCSSCCI